MNAMPSMFDKGAAPVLERAMSFQEQRHRLIARNIANVETPGYRPVDAPVAEFQALLRRSIAERDSRPVQVFAMQSGRDVHAGRTLALNPVASHDGILRHGENAVDIDREAALLARNAMEFRAAASLLKKQYALIRDTISEKP